MKIPGFVHSLAAIAALIAWPSLAVGQLSANAGDSPATTALAETGATIPQFALTYNRPTDKRRFRNYLLEAFGPYPVANAAVFGAYDTFENAPPEWKQGAAAYGERF